MRCFVCEADLSGRDAEGENEVEEDVEDQKKGEKKKKSSKAGNVGRLVEISCEGTGFAGGGANMAKREGVAFQC